jgi:hypothetical protein
VAAPTLSRSPSAIREIDLAVLDCVREIRARFSPESATRELAHTLKSYGLDRVTGDRFGGLWPSDQFARHGVRYEPSLKSKSEIYSEALPLINSGKLDLLDNRRLLAQVCALERRTSRAGKDGV